MAEHLSIDFETLGTSPDSVVISLGAVIFTREKIISEKLWYFDMTEQLNGRKQASAATLVWWMSQGEKAKGVFNESLSNGIYLKEFVYQFVEFVRPHSALRTWSNGAGFDIPILEHIFQQQGVSLPLKFTNHRCYRTMKQCMGVGRGMSFEGVHHDALDDSRHQAKCLMAFFQKNPEADK